MGVPFRYSFRCTAVRLDVHNGLPIGDCNSQFAMFILQFAIAPFGTDLGTGQRLGMILGKPKAKRESLRAHQGCRLDRLPSPGCRPGKRRRPHISSISQGRRPDGL